MIPEFPKLDPITGRKICRPCWNGVHRKHNADEILVDACVGDCDCVHLSEANLAAIERRNIRRARKEKAELEKDALEAPDNPLRAENPNFKKPLTGRVHA